MSKDLRGADTKVVVARTIQKQASPNTLETVPS